MTFYQYKKHIITLLLGAFVFVVQGPAQPQHEEDERASNLKVLPRNIAPEELHRVMKEYARSLGVRCGFCHAPRTDNPEKLDFSSDAKEEKGIARKMISMTAGINKKYISKIGHGQFEKITCVTCHMGHVKPLVHVDSLVKN